VYILIQFKGRGKEMKNWKLFTLLLALVVVLAACGSDNTSSEPEKEEATETQTASETESEGPVYPMTVKSTVSSTENEEKGTIVYEDVTLDKMPEKIVVFDYGFLDTLDTLGVEGIVGVAKGNFPENIAKYAGDEYGNAGSLKGPLLEDIAEMDPDVIFISGRQSSFYEELKEIAPVVFVGTSQQDYWNTFMASVELAGEMFGKEEEVKEELAKYDAALEEVKALSGGFDNILVSMYNEGKISGFSTNSRFGYIYDVYGFKPVTEDIESSSHGSNFGYEAILEFNPQALLVIDRTAATGGESNIKKDFENDIIKKTDAYKNGRVVYLDGALWYLGGGGLTSELAKINEVLDELK